jgi:hypothetical protein
MLLLLAQLSSHIKRSEWVAQSRRSPKEPGNVTESLAWVVNLR